MNQKNELTERVSKRLTNSFLKYLQQEIFLQWSHLQIECHNIFHDCKHDELFHSCTRISLNLFVDSMDPITSTRQSFHLHKDRLNVVSLLVLQVERFDLNQANKIDYPVQCVPLRFYHIRISESREWRERRTNVNS